MYKLGTYCMSDPSKTLFNARKLRLATSHFHSDIWHFCRDSSSLHNAVPNSRHRHSPQTTKQSINSCRNRRLKKDTSIFSAAPSNFPCYPCATYVSAAQESGLWLSLPEPIHANPGLAANQTHVIALEWDTLCNSTDEYIGLYYLCSRYGQLSMSVAELVYSNVASCSTRIWSAWISITRHDKPHWQPKKKP